MRITPAEAPIGADVLGLDLDGADTPALAEALQAALDRHLVLRFPAAHLDQAQLIRLAGLFGTVLTDRRNPDEPDTAHIDAVPELKVIANTRTADGRPFGDKGSEPQIWHSDGTHRVLPNAYSLLACQAAPEPPPATEFMSCYALYERLPAALRREIAALSAIHSLHNRSQGFWSFMEGASLPVEKRAEGPAHPLVRLHPRTHRPFLYLPRRRDALVAGWSAEASRRLMERLWAEVFACDAIVSVPLRAGDAVLNDNRATLHARDGWPEEAARVIFHVSVAPEAPIAAYPPPRLAA